MRRANIVKIEGIFLRHARSMLLKDIMRGTVVFNTGLLPFSFTAVLG